MICLSVCLFFHLCLICQLWNRRKFQSAVANSIFLSDLYLYPIGPIRGISELQYTICHGENLAICHMLIRILTYMQYANGISCGSAREVPNRASFRPSEGRPNTIRPTSQPCPQAHLETWIGSKQNRPKEHNKNLRYHVHNLITTLEIDQKYGLLAIKYLALIASLSDKFQ